MASVNMMATPVCLRGMQRVEKAFEFGSVELFVAIFIEASDQTRQSARMITVPAVMPV